MTRTAVFCHDHYYYHDGDTILSKGQYHHNVWDRYKPHFNAITILGRDGGHADKTDPSINISSAPHLSFQLFPNMNSIKGILKNKKNIKNKIKKSIEKQDVIIIRGTSELGKIAYNAAKKQNKIIAIEVVSCAFDELWNHGSIVAKLYAPFRFLSQRKMVKNADAVIYVTQSFLQNRYPTKARLIARASNVQLPDDAFCHDAPISPNHPFRIGLIGTLKNKLKGVDVAIEACKILKAQGITNFHLDILGPGEPSPYQSRIDEYGLTPHITLLGTKKSGQPVWDWLRSLDLYIQPSFQEGVPRAMIEAMAQSLPCVGSNAGGIPELLSDEFIVPKGDARALATAIKLMMDNPAMRETASSDNFKTAQNYSEEKLNFIRRNFWGNVVQMVADKK